LRIGEGEELRELIDGEQEGDVVVRLAAAKPPSKGAIARLKAGIDVVPISTRK
jgi:hypothetical protein